jgi:hypothetical protein
MQAFYDLGPARMALTEGRGTGPYRTSITVSGQAPLGGCWKGDRHSPMPARQVRREACRRSNSVDERLGSDDSNVESHRSAIAP